MAGELGKASLELEADLTEFEGNVTVARKSSGDLRNALAGVASIANIAEAALNDVKLSPQNAAESRASAASILAGVHGISDEATVAAAEMDRVKLSTGNAAETAASAAIITAALDSIDAAAGDARRSIEGLDAVSGASAAAGGAGAGGGLLAALGLGGGKFGAAGFGTALGLAGFGFESILAHIIGILGSLGGGLIGGGLLGLGALGTSAVGMGTDLAGIGQAAGDIKLVSTALGNLNTAIATYGAHSAQAAAAQKALDQQLAGFSPVARNAVLAAAQTAQGFRAMFDKFTGPAEKIGAEIIDQAMMTGEKFLPTLGRFAAQNMGIIQRQLQPLFAWLQNPGFSKPGFGGGLGIFTNLEQIFQRNLPAAVQAGSQALEFFVRTVDVAAQQTGHFMQTLDNFFTRMNQPGNFAKWATDVDKLIGLFRTWLGLFGALAKTVFALLRPAVGFGAAFAVELTKIVNQVREWLNLNSTQATLHGLFDVHLVEVIQGLGQVIRALLPAIEQATIAFLKMETVMSAIAGGALKALAAIIHQIMRIPFAAQIIGWAAAIRLVVAANKALLGLSLVSKFGDIIKALIGMKVAEKGVAVASEEATGAEATAGAAGSGLLGLGAAADAMIGPFLAAAAAVYGLDKALKALTGFDILKFDWGSAGFGADNLNDAIKKAGSKNPYPQGTSDYYEWQLGYEGKPPTNTQGKKVPRSAAYEQGAAARKRTHQGHHSKHTQHTASHTPATHSAAWYQQHYGTPSTLPTVTASHSGTSSATHTIHHLTPAQREELRLQHALLAAELAAQKATQGSKKWDEAIAAEEKALRAEIKFWDKRAHDRSLSLKLRDAALRKELAYEKQLKSLTAQQAKNAAANEQQFLSEFANIENTFGSNVLPVKKGQTDTHLYDIKQEARQTNRHLSAIRRKRRFPASESGMSAALAVG